MSEASAPSGSPFAWTKKVGSGLSVGFTGVEAGNLAMHTEANSAAVIERRGRVEQQIGASKGALKFMHQTHSTTVVAVEHAPGNLRADALMATDGRTPLAVMIADCLPVLLAGRTHKGWATAAVHAGRVGLIGGILPKAVAQMRGEGAADIQAWIGPSICGLCYEVPASMHADVAMVLPACAARTRKKTPSLDLPAGALAQLEQLGVDANCLGICTLEDSRYYSYRGGAVRERFAGVIWTEAARRGA